MSIILVFTSVYFTLTLGADRDDSVDRYLYYNSAGRALASGRIELVNPYPHPGRAFYGMEERLWGTADDTIPLWIYRDLQDIERYLAETAARSSLDAVVTYNKSSVLPVLADCLHLSVMTITSVGYGNVAPRTWYAKLATDVEAITGTMLLVVGLGLVFSGETTNQRAFNARDDDGVGSGDAEIT